jgi:hypothetical protein
MQNVRSRIRGGFSEVAIGDFGNRMGQRNDWAEFVVIDFSRRSSESSRRSSEDGTFCLCGSIAIHILCLLK